MASSDVKKQSNSLVYNVYSYLKELDDTKPDATVKELFSQAQKATAIACGVSYRTVQRICAEANRNAAAHLMDNLPLFESSKKKNPRKKRVTELNDFDKNIIRRTVQGFYDRGEYPSLHNLHKSLRGKIEFSGCVKSLWIILKNLGFKYKKCKDGRKILMEGDDIVASRIIFLRKMHNLRNESYPRPVIYLDETWLSENHSRKNIWPNSTSQGGLKIPVDKGSGLIICHAGSGRDGFIQSAQLVIQSECKADYNQKLNNMIFKEWFINLLGVLKEPSVIVMDNASYHSSCVENIPTIKTPKPNIISWLQSKNIDHNPDDTIPELLNIVNQHQDKYKVYELDKIAYEMGHEVVRLPPYHCQYNPIELIWAEVKGEIADKNSTSKIEDVRKLLDEALCHVSIDDWKICVQHAEKLQEEDLVNESIRDDIIQNWVSDLQDESDSSFIEIDNEPS